MKLKKVSITKLKKRLQASQENSQENTQLQKKKPDCRPKNIPIEVLIHYHEKGLNNTEIAQLLGVSRENVSRRLNALGINNLGYFKQHLAGVILQKLREIISCITPEEIQKAPLNTKIYAFGVLYDKYRLETGQSTQNIDIHAVVRELKSTNIVNIKKI